MPIAASTSAFVTIAHTSSSPVDGCEVAFGAVLAAVAAEVTAPPGAAVVAGADVGLFDPLPPPPQAASSRTAQATGNAATPRPEIILRAIRSTCLVSVAIAPGERNGGHTLRDEPERVKCHVSHDATKTMHLDASVCEATEPVDSARRRS